jgi:hypothetical protein
MLTVPPKPIASFDPTPAPPPTPKRPIATVRSDAARVVPPRQVVAPPPAPAPTPPPAAPVAAPLDGFCPTGMARVAASTPYCIDRYEAPGEGRAPRVNLTREDAQRACSALGRRLCTAKEWERACRGSRGASYPYGSSFVPERCHVRAGAPPGPAGATATCLSASTAYDMSGNAAEWVQTGAPRGGSSAGTHDGRCSRPSPMPELGHATDVGYRCCVDAR